MLRTLLTTGFLTTGFRWAWRLFLVAIVFFNARLYWPSPLEHNRGKVPTALLKQLKANRAELEGDAPDRMQQLFPEGRYFCYSLHGLTWVEAAVKDENLREQALSEARYCYAQIDSDVCRSTFNLNLTPDHGMFYSAWKAHLQAGIALLDQDRGEEIEQLRAECDELKSAFDRAGSPFLESYQGGIWPCDSIPAIHAMVCYDQLTGESRYADFVKHWLVEAKALVDSETGLIPHSNLIDGDVGRATSQMILLRMLPDIDAEFAKQQYELFREQFVTTFVGIPCVYEFPNGQSSSWGDVDTGPLIFGRSLSATVFMIGTAQIYDDTELADTMAIAGETVGLPWTYDGEKRYWNGVLPVGDIMVGYSQNATTWFEGDQHNPEQRYEVSTFWRVPTHLISALFFIPVIIKWRSKRRRSHSESVASDSQESGF